MKVLGIESSCDETGIAIYDGEKGIIADNLYSQIAMHAEYGGVVPELASRDHIRKIAPLIDQTFRDAGVDKVDGVAFTAGPGLIGALLVGATVGRSLAYAWDVPAVAVHHMEGHLLAPMLAARKPEFPFVALLVSGGHTQLVEVRAIGDYQILGESIDDAAGEAFDKTAKLLDLGFPGGPKIAERALEGADSPHKFPRPMTDRPGLDFSFSGLKTFAANTFAASGKTEKEIAQLCFSFQEAVVDTLVIKCRRALKQTNIKNLVIAGGVSANLQLRESLGKLMKDLGGEVFYPELKYCTDNGAMIALAGYFRLKAGEHEGTTIRARPRWPMDELEKLASQ